MLYAIRFSLPDRPGTLGAVATALSHLPADVVSMWVVERDGEHAVDEMCLEASGVLPDGIRDAVQSIPGVVVESVRRVDQVPDPMMALELAEALTGTTLFPTLHTLVEGIAGALSASWAAALDFADGVEVLRATQGAPVAAAMDTPWMPLISARRLPPGDWMPQAWRLFRPELAAVGLGTPTSALVVGRPTGMRFRPSELRQLDALTRMALRTGLVAVPG